jgi:hypothetical protein
MTGADLRAEYLTALRTTTFEDLRPLRDAGIGEQGLMVGLAVASIRLSRDRSLFEFDPDADAAAFILPIRIEHAISPEAADPARAVREGEIADLLAFSPNHPARWALRMGNATWLGNIEPQYLAPDPVPVWRTPLHWLRNNCRGLVLLDRDRRAQYRVLISCDAILAEDERHAIELRELLRQPWLAPPVLVRRGRAVRNAA